MTDLDRRVAVSLSVLAIAACGGEPDAPSRLSFEVRDSAGVTIVENQAPAPGSRMDWQVGAAPEVSIGALEGAPEYQLYQVGDAMRTADGGILVGNRGSNEIRVYDATGTYVDSWGGEGEGPGEFTGLSSIDAWSGDSVIVADFRQRRMTVFAADGTLGRTFQLQQSEDVGVPSYQGVLPDGSLVVSAASVFTAGQAEPGLTRRPRVFARLTAEGGFLGSLGEHPGSEAFVRAGEGFVMVTSHPYARASSFAVWGDLLLISANDTYELKVYDLDGTLARIVRRDYTVAVPTQADLDAYVESTIEDVPEEARAQRRQMMEGIPLVDAYPAYASVRVDAMRYLWVAEYVPPRTGDGPTVWTVFDPDGRVEGFVETPADLTIREIGEDYILGTTRDDFDVEYVHVYALTRPST